MLFPYTEWNSFVIFYFGLGVFQLLSYILHFPRRVKRRELSETYSYILVGIIVFGLLGLLINETLFALLFIMLFLGIFMALYYLIHTYNNLKIYQDEK
jgi:undecaprenyl pyrophosphate phosphatase UppP